MMKLLALIGLSLTLAACGSRADLQPQVGKTLPQKPALASRPMTAEELLILPPQADPRRVDELSKRGEIREGDRFDLPPPDGEIPSPPESQEPQH